MNSGMSDCWSRLELHLRRCQVLCTLFLQAQKLGFTVLTANLAEFDLLFQLVPTGRVLFYRVGA